MSASAESRFTVRHLYAHHSLEVPGDPPLTVVRGTHPLVWHVHDTARLRVELYEAIYNWRIAVSLADVATVEGAWCYFGLDFEVFTRAARAAHAFDPTTQTAPEGYDKEVVAWDPTWAPTAPPLGRPQ